MLVGGGKIGTIDEIELDDSAQAVVTLKLDDDFAPLHQGTTATIRATSLSGIANRYVSLQPGPNNSDEIDDGGQIGADDTSAPVDLDTLFNTLDTAHPRRPAERHPRLGRPVRRKGQAGREAHQVLQPVPASAPAI